MNNISLMQKQKVSWLTKNTIKCYFLIWLWWATKIAKKNISVTIGFLIVHLFKKRSINWVDTADYSLSAHRSTFQRKNLNYLFSTSLNIQLPWHFFFATFLWCLDTALLVTKVLLLTSFLNFNKLKSFFDKFAGLHRFASSCFLI